MKASVVFSILVVLAFSGCKGDRQQPLSGQVTVEEASKSSRVPNQESLQTAIRDQVHAMEERLLAGDLDGFFSYFHPEIVKMAGSTDALKRKMDPQLLHLVTNMATFSIGNISEVVDEGGSLAAFVSVNAVFDLPEGIFRHKSYYIASSWDGGKIWKFVAGQGHEEQENAFREMFPVLTRKAPFPECGMTKVR